MSHDEFVIGGPAGVSTGFDDQGTGVGKSSFPAENGVLDEHAWCEVAVIRPLRSSRLSLHLPTIWVWFTFGFLDHQSDC
jgi:hypothetical protein